MSGNDFERNTDHLLFRTLVLMGGALALGCGGSVVVSGNAAGEGGSRAVGGAPPADLPPGGTSAGGGGASPVDAGASDCPPAQWDCSALSPCNYYWTDQGRPEGCVCDAQRPKSVADCRPNENLFCLAAGFTDPQSWDGIGHVQCTCVPFQTSPLAYDECRQQCASTYPALDDNGGIHTVQCARPQDETCDEFGHCTATPASVLRQDGIVCGCASIILK